MNAQAYQYIRIDDPNQLEPGDSVYEVVQFGQNETDVKYNELRVMSIERKAIVALRQAGPRGGRPIKLPFSALVMRVPAVEPRASNAIVATVPKRAHAILRSVPEPVAVAIVPQKPDAFAAYLELSEGFLQELRLELDGLDDEKAELEKERDELETNYRQEVDKLNELMRKLNHAHHKEHAALDGRIDAIEQRRAPLQDKVKGIETILVTVRG